jgi:hypothetical protein
MKNKRPSQIGGWPRFSFEDTCMFGALIECALCGLPPHDESK